VVTTIPTIGISILCVFVCFSEWLCSHSLGFNVETVNYKDYEFTIWDVGTWLPGDFHLNSILISEEAQIRFDPYGDTISTTYEFLSCTFYSSFSLFLPYSSRRKCFGLSSIPMIECDWMRRKTNYVSFSAMRSSVRRPLYLSATSRTYPMPWDRGKWWKDWRLVAT
jgi:hypothetical protein